MSERLLFGYWRSSAAWRVRLALAAKGLDYRQVPVDLRTGAQASADFRARNPQGLVPWFVDGESALGQSLAIIEYLDETWPQVPLLPADALGRARVRSAAQTIACDIHPVNNLRVLNYLKTPLGHDQSAIDEWARHWMALGLTALEDFAVRHAGFCLYGSVFTIADICLLPQLYNARRFGLELADFPQLLSIEAYVSNLDFVAATRPENQPDTP